MYKILIIVRGEGITAMYRPYVENGDIWQTDDDDELESKIEELNTTMADNAIFPITDIKYKLRAEITM